MVVEHSINREKKKKLYLVAAGLVVVAFRFKNRLKAHKVND